MFNMKEFIESKLTDVSRVDEAVVNENVGEGDNILKIVKAIRGSYGYTSDKSNQEWLGNDLHKLEAIAKRLKD